MVSIYVYYAEISFLGGSEVKASACDVGDLGSIPGLGRSPGEGNGNPLQYLGWGMERKENISEINTWFYS